MRSKRSPRGTAVATIVIAGSAVVALAAGGDLDLTFGTGGIAQTQFTTTAQANGAVVQSDGKIVVGGWEPTGGNSHWRIERRLADGALDTSYGSNGVVALFATPGSSTSAGDLAVDGSGRVLAAGVSVVSTTSHGKTTVTQFATVARLTTGGALDSSFGAGGSVLISVPNSIQSIASAVAVQPDGKILIGGKVKFPVKGNAIEQFAIFVARLGASGSLDGSFGSGGIRVHDVTAADDDVRRGGVALQSDGKIVVGGAVITRYLANGAIDTAFGTVQGPGGAADSLQGIAVDASDRIVATGWRNSGTNVSDMLAVRYGANGVLDTSFGSGGVALVHVGARNEVYGGPAIQPGDGKIVFAGSVVSTSASQAMAVRLDADGTLDSTFGTGGVTSQIAIGTYNLVRETALAPDGRIVVAGNANFSNTSSWFVARFDAN